MSTPTSAQAAAAAAAALLATIEAGIRSLNTVKCCCVAGIAWMVYDILINLDREVKHFWFGKWSLPRVLYFLNRYFSLARVVFFVIGLFHPLSTPFCTASIYVQTWTGACEIWFLQMILIYRVNALYRTKKILISIIVFFLCSAAAVMAIIQTAVGSSKTEAVRLPGLSACIPTAKRSKLGEIWAFWVPILVFESFLFALALRSLVRNIGTIRKDALLFRSNSHLIELILRDSMWYFLMVCLIDIASLLIWQSPHVAAGTEWTTGFTAPFFSIAGSRLLLNLREYGDVMEYITGTAAPPPHTNSWRGTERHSAIEFSPRSNGAKSTFDDSSTAVHASILHASGITSSDYTI